jgi:hypothetical protein
VLSAVLACGVVSGSVQAKPATLAIAAPPGDSAPLRPGSAVSVSWPAGVGLQNFDEMELVLSVDGGRTFPVRVTRRIAPADLRVSWVVPGLPAAHARLALRAGADGDAEEETILAVSGDFAIGTSPDRPEELFRVGDEERTRDALEELPPPALPDALADGGPTLLAGRDDLELAEGPSQLQADPGRGREQSPFAVPLPHAALRPIRSESGPSAVPLPLRL